MLPGPARRCGATDLRTDEVCYHTLSDTGREATNRPQRYWVSPLAFPFSSIPFSGCGKEFVMAQVQPCATCDTPVEVVAAGPFVGAEVVGVLCPASRQGSGRAFCLDLELSV